MRDKEQLTKILTCHVVPSKADVQRLDTITTVEGSNLKIDTSSGVKVSDATVTQADIEADNGVIHVMDTVLLPE